MKPIIFVLLLLGFSACAGRPGPAICSVVQVGNSTAGADIGIGDSSFAANGGARELAQSFYLSNAVMIQYVDVPLYKIGTILNQDLNTVRLRLETSVSDRPSDVLAASGAEGVIPVSQIPSTSYAYQRFTFTGGVTLQPGTYWIHLKGTYNNSGTDHVKWVAHDGAGGYADGHASYLNNTGWATDNIGLRDFLFNIGC